jgi:hypothetical protein
MLRILEFILPQELRVAPFHGQLASTPPHATIGHTARGALSCIQAQTDIVHPDSSTSGHQEPQKIPVHLMSHKHEYHLVV